jgi:hypothetical protein
MQAASGTQAAKDATETFEEQIGLRETVDELNADEQMQNGEEAESVPLAKAVCKGGICIVTLTEHHFTYLTAEYEVTESSAATSTKLLQYECGEYGRSFCEQLQASAAEIEAAAAEPGAGTKEGQAEIDERFAEEGGDGPG